MALRANMLRFLSSWRVLLVYYVSAWGMGFGTEVITIFNLNGYFCLLQAWR